MNALQDNGKDHVYLHIYIYTYIYIYIYIYIKGLSCQHSQAKCSMLKTEQVFVKDINNNNLIVIIRPDCHLKLGQNP